MSFLLLTSALAVPLLPWLWGMVSPRPLQLHSSWSAGCVDFEDGQLDIPTVAHNNNCWIQARCPNLPLTSRGPPRSAWAGYFKYAYFWIYTRSFDTAISGVRATWVGSISSSFSFLTRRCHPSGLSLSSTDRGKHSQRVIHHTVAGWVRWAGSWKQG